MSLTDALPSFISVIKNNLPHSLMVFDDDNHSAFKSVETFRDDPIGSKKAISGAFKTTISSRLRLTGGELLLRCSVVQLNFIQKVFLPPARFCLHNLFAL